MKHESEVIIYRNRGVVFEHLTNPEKIKLWLDEVLSTTPFSELKIGAPYRQSIRISMGVEELAGEVTEFSKDERFSFILSTHASKISVSYVLTAFDGGATTKLLATEEITPVSLLAKLAVPAVAIVSKRKQEADLSRLKRFLDHGGDQR